MALPGRLLGTTIAMLPIGKPYLFWRRTTVFAKMKTLFIIALFVLGMLGTVLYTVYHLGVQRYGTPSEFRARQAEQITALKDSLAAARTLGSPVNVGDSTMVGLTDHSDVFRKETVLDDRLDQFQVSLDSLRLERDRLIALSADVEIQRELFAGYKENARRATIVSMAKLYDVMKPQQSVPLFLSMNDTLAVMIISNMEDRNAGRALAGIAETDIEKANRINSLLAEMGVLPK